MEKEKETQESRKLWPGDEGYQGGESRGTVSVNGVAKNARVVRDENGNIVYLGLTDKVFGIF